MHLDATLEPPPDEPWPIDWAAVEGRLGVRLPTDYKAFAERYGPVLVGDRVWVLVPHRSDEGGYLGELAQSQGLHRSLRDTDPPAHPFAFHPEPGGLLAWGR